MWQWSCQTVSHICLCGESTWNPKLSKYGIHKKTPPKALRFHVHSSRSVSYRATTNVAARPSVLWENQGVRCLGFRRAPWALGHVNTPSGIKGWFLVPTMIMESQGPKGVGQVAKYPAIFWECLALWEDMASPHVPFKGGKWAGRMNSQTSPQKRGDLEPPTRTTNQHETDVCGTLQPFRFLHLLKSVFVSVCCPVLTTTANICRFFEATSATFPEVPQRTIFRVGSMSGLIHPNPRRQKLGRGCSTNRGHPPIEFSRGMYLDAASSMLCQAWRRLSSDWRRIGFSFADAKDAI